VVEHYGYGLVSTTGQTVEPHRVALHAARCKTVRVEKVGATEPQPEPEVLLAFLRSGDTLVVTRIDRLARSAVELLKIVSDLREGEIALKALDDVKIPQRAGLTDAPPT
jgi:DNA invertase Pin-like site-specific DNA recombinase